MTSDTGSPPSVFSMEAGNHAADGYNLYDDWFGSTVRNIWRGVQKITNFQVYTCIYLCIYLAHSRYIQNRLCKSQQKSQNGATVLV